MGGPRGAHPRGARRPGRGVGALALPSRRAAAAWGRELLLPRVPGNWGATAWASWAARMPAQWRGKGFWAVSARRGQREEAGWLLTASWAKRRGGAN